jgi:hypothetical protein
MFAINIARLNGRTPTIPSPIPCRSALQCPVIILLIFFIFVLIPTPGSIPNQHTRPSPTTTTTTTIPPNNPFIPRPRRHALPGMLTIRRLDIILPHHRNRLVIGVPAHAQICRESREAMRMRMRMRMRMCVWVWVWVWVRIIL